MEYMNRDVNEPDAVLNLCVRKSEHEVHSRYSPPVRSEIKFDVKEYYRPKDYVGENILQAALQRNNNYSYIKTEPGQELSVITNNNGSSFRPVVSPAHRLHNDTVMYIPQEEMRSPVSEIDTCSVGSNSLGVEYSCQPSAQASLPQTVTSATTRGGKPTRPFKAYPKDPLSLTAGAAVEISLGCDSNEAYAEFRRRMLSQVQATTGVNKNMKRPVQAMSPPNQQPSSSMDSKDNNYWERRRKNNEAAKRSRDARRAKEDEIAIRAAFLEQENLKLKYEVAALRNETSRLRCLLYSN